MRHSLRVLMIAETYPPDYGGGAAIYIRDVCRALAEHGHSVRLVCVDGTDGEPYSIRERRDGDVEVFGIRLPYFRTVDPDGAGLSLREWIRHERRVRSLITDEVRRFRPEIAQYNTARPFGEAAIFALHDCGVPIVAMFHEAWLICARSMLLRSPTARACDGPGPFRCLQCVYSHYDGGHLPAAVKLPWRLLKLGPLPMYRLLRRAIARRKLRGGVGYSRFMTATHADRIAGPVRHISLGIDSAQTPLPASRPRTPLRFGFLGGAQPNKGLADLLDAAVQLKRDGLSFELGVWGPGIDAVHAEVRARNLSDRVRVHGVFSTGERGEVYGQVDVAVMASVVNEPFGRIVQEAAFAGAPTIGPAIGGIREQIRHDVDGLLYEFRDARELHKQMRRVLVEPDLVPRLIANLPAVPTTTEAVSELEDFYFDILGGSDRLRQSSSASEQAARGTPAKAGVVQP